MPSISQVDPVPEAVKNMISPDRPGVSYVAKRYLVTDLEPGGANSTAFSIRNPEEVDCIVTNVVVDITSAGGSAASVLDVDVVAGPDDSGDNIIDGLNLNATGIGDRYKNGGTNGGSAVKWERRGGGNDYLTGSIKAQRASNLGGKVMVEYVPLT